MRLRLRSRDYEMQVGVPACADAYFSQWRPNIHGGVRLYNRPDQFRRRRIGLVNRYLLRNARFGIDLKIAAPLFLPTLLLPTSRGWPVGADRSPPGHGVTCLGLSDGAGCVSTG